MTEDNQALRDLLAAERDIILKGWLDAAGGATRSLPKDAGELYGAIEEGLRAGGSSTNFEQAPWAATREVLARISRDGAARGDSAGDTSRFVLAFKRPVFESLQRRVGADSMKLTSSLWFLSSLVDQLAQFTVTTYQQTREEIIKRQQLELLELSTPVVKLWDGVLAVPMIGTLDSARTQHVMEALLQRIVDSGSELAIIDITGVPTVDTLVAQHLLKTVTAIRLMGADCIISGIRPQIAQTIVHLGIDLQGITTKATLADALLVALKQVGYAVVRNKAQAAAAGEGA